MWLNRQTDREMVMITILYGPKGLRGKNETIMFTSSCTILRYEVIIKAIRLMEALPASGPPTVVILVVDYISELTIHSLYIHPVCVKEMYNISFIVKLM